MHRARGAAVGTGTARHGPDRCQTPRTCGATGRGRGEPPRTPRRTRNGSIFPRTDDTRVSPLQLHARGGKTHHLRRPTRHDATADTRDHCRVRASRRIPRCCSVLRDFASSADLVSQIAFACSEGAPATSGHDRCWLLLERPRHLEQWAVHHFDKRHGCMVPSARVGLQHACVAAPAAFIAIGKNCASTKATCV